MIFTVIINLITVFLNRLTKCQLAHGDPEYMTSLFNLVDNFKLIYHNYVIIITGCDNSDI